MNIEDAGTSLLAIASRNLKDGRVVPAFAIFAGVSKLDGFTHRGQAELGKSAARMQLPDQAAAMAAREKLQMIVEQHSHKTVYRGKALSLLAEANIILGDTEQASMNLEEAAEIFTYQGEYRKLAKVIHLQASVDIWQGDPEAALKKFNRATTFHEIDIPIPSFVPAGLSPDRTFEDESDIASLAALATSVS